MQPFLPACAGISLEGNAVVRVSQARAKKKENNREFFEFDLEIIEVCPKSINFALRQGVNSDFCGFLYKPSSTKHSTAFCSGFKKITGN
jgi:hypothetical protein